MKTIAIDISGRNLPQIMGDVDSNFEAVIQTTGLPDEVVSITLIPGYISNSNGVFSNYPAQDIFRCDVNYYPKKEAGQYKYTGAIADSCGIAFYSEQNEASFISGISVLPADGILVFPTNANYVRLSDFQAGGDHSGASLTILYPGLLLPMIEDLRKNIEINCEGDSVTEGMETDGVGTAEYGKAPYPAALNTILVDGGYKIPVNNYGYGGERTIEICARLGAIAAYITEQIVIPYDNTPQSLGTAIITDGRVSGTKLAVFDTDTEDVDFNVFFTQTRNTNPLYIDEVPYTLSVVGNEMLIAKYVPDGILTTIKAGSLVFTSNHRNPSVNVIYGGINDLGSLTLEKYILRNKLCGQVNGGKYIIIGCTYPIWNTWADITAPDKYAYYLRQCRENFGVHFLDLYDLFFNHAVDYALSAGYLTALTSEQIAAVRVNMTNKVMDACFTYDGSTQNIHLNDAGYHVIAMLLFNLLKRLNYI